MVSPARDQVAQLHALDFLLLAVDGAEDAHPVRRALLGGAAGHGDRLHHGQVTFNHVGPGNLDVAGDEDGFRLRNRDGVAVAKREAGGHLAALQLLQA